MQKTCLCLLLILPIALAGCLKFGEDEETTKPTAIQVSRCRSEMYLNPSMNIVPLGFKLNGSGIDDAIWFKFKTDSTDLSLVFDKKVVDITKFKEGFTLSQEKGVKWWDIKGKSLLGGQVPLPNARVMNVGIEKEHDACMVYIMWFET